jgi:putative peptidoglycan lipid II flippase
VLLTVKLAVLAPVIVLLLTRGDLLASSLDWNSLNLPIIWIMCFLLLLGAFSDVLYQFLIAFFRQGGRNAIDVVTTLVQSGLVIVLVTQFGLTGAFFALLLATVVNVLLGTWLVRRAIHNVHVKPDFSSTWKSIYNRLARFSGLSFVMNLSAYLYDLPFVILVLTYFGDTLGVALFGIAFSRVVMPILRVLLTPLTGVQMPLFTRIQGENNSAKLQDAYSTVSRILCLWLIPGAIGLAILAEPMIVLFFQARYADAARTAQVLAIFLFLESILSSGQTILLVYDRYRAVLLSRAIALVSVPLLFAAVPLWGVVGAALAIGIGRVVARLVSVVFVSRYYDIAFPWAFFVRLTLISLAMGVAMYIPVAVIGSATPFDHALKLILGTAVGILVFAVLFRVFGGLSAQDKQRLLTMPIPFKRALSQWL